MQVTLTDSAIVLAVFEAGEVVPVATTAAVLELHTRTAGSIERITCLRLRAWTAIDFQVTKFCASISFDILIKVVWNYKKCFFLVCTRSFRRRDVRLCLCRRHRERLHGGRDRLFRTPRLTFHFRVEVIFISTTPSVVEWPTSFKYNIIICIAFTSFIILYVHPVYALPLFCSVEEPPLCIVRALTGQSRESTNFLLCNFMKVLY